MAPAYHQALGSHKQQMLEEFVTATGYVRKYAQGLLNHSEEVAAGKILHGTMHDVSRDGVR
jgi:hypothetical protein